MCQLATTHGRGREGYIDPRVDVVNCRGEPGGIVGYIFVGVVNEVVEFGV